MTVPVRSSILYQVEVAYCLSALVELAHHSRQWERLMKLRQQLSDDLNNQLDHLLPRVRWESIMTWPLLPEDWPPAQTGTVIIDRLSSLPEAELVSSLSGWVVDDEDIVAIRRDPDLPARILPAASSEQLSLLLGAVLEPQKILSQMERIVPEVWRTAWPGYSQLLQHAKLKDMIQQSISLDRELDTCCHLLGMNVPFDQITLAWSYFSHPHGEGVCSHNDLLTITTWFNNWDHAKSLTVHEALHVFVANHMRYLVDNNVLKQLRTPHLTSLHLTHAAKLPAWEQWIEEHIVAACHNLIISKLGLVGQAEVLTEFQENLTNLLASQQSTITPDILAELLLVAAR